MHHRTLKLGVRHARALPLPEDGHPCLCSLGGIDLERGGTLQRSFDRLEDDSDGWEHGQPDLVLDHAAIGHHRLVGEHGVLALHPLGLILQAWVTVSLRLAHLPYLVERHVEFASFIFQEYHGLMAMPMLFSMSRAGKYSETRSSPTLLISARRSSQPSPSGRDPELSGNA